MPTGTITSVPTPWHVLDVPGASATGDWRATLEPGSTRQILVHQLEKRWRELAAVNRWSTVFGARFGKTGMHLRQELAVRFTAQHIQWV